MPKYLDGNGLAYFWGKIKSLFTNVVYHESDDGTSGEASIPSSDANIIEVVKVNGDPLTPDANKAVDIQVPTSLSQLSPDSTHRVVTDTEKTTWNNKGTYTKPSGGIPATDLEDGVIPIVPTNVSAFTNDAGYLTQHQSLSGYATTQDLEDAKVFFAEANVTTFAEIKDAIDAGRTVMLKDEDGYPYVLSYIDDTYISFSCSSGDEMFIKTYNVYDDDSWELLAVYDIESRQNLVQSISSQSSSSQYPSAYAVYQALQSYTPTSNLAAVATSGDYDDLTNKPTIPAAQIQSDWSQSDNTAKDFIKNKPTIPDGMELLTLDEDEGTLTQEQIALVQSDHCIIVFDDEYYYKNYLEGAALEYILNYIDYTDNGICQKVITIDTSEGSYTIGEHSLGIQSDWDESDSTSVAYIKNKPALTNYVQKSQTAGLLKNDGTVDTTQYGTYTKPSGGIPSSDMTSAVQTSLGKADSAYQKPSGGIPASDLASGVIPSVPVQDVTVGGSTVLNNGVAVIPAIPDINTTADKVVVVDASTLPSTLDPNKVYQMWTLTGTVTIPEFTSIASGDTEAKIWCFTFNTSTTAPNINWPTGITKWAGGSLPTINASKYYEVTAMDGIGVIIESSEVSS